MIDLRRSEDRGHADHGWLDTHHTFSFADYHDPAFQRFGVLRVLNQDRVQPGTGFGMHGHRDMEIVSYVLQGVLQHRDSMGHGSRVNPGDVQLMSAGTGVTHSEFNASETGPLHLIQMWVLPREQGTTPRYEQATFPADERAGRLRLVVSPDGEQGSLRIAQDARLRVCTLRSGDVVRHPLPEGRDAWLHVATGRLLLGDEPLGPGDGAAIRAERLLTLTGLEEAELLLWEVPAT